MFKQSTTIIVGAGASCELGLPSGEELKDQIVQMLNTTTENGYGFANELMQNAMKSLVKTENFNWHTTFNPYKLAAERIRRGLPLALSIDNFLHTHQDDQYVVQVGKLAIALCILSAERRSCLFPKINAMLFLADRAPAAKPAISGDGLRDTWYPIFAQLLLSQTSRNNIKQAFSNLRFVIFNYDRCLEQFLWMALQSYFDIDGDEAAIILKDVRFSHPYGSLGNLPWQTDGDDGVALGDHATGDPWRLAERLSTFTESVHSEIGETVREAVERAETILILGFGYLDQNLQLLQPVASKQAHRIISTAYKVSEPDQSVMRGAMKRLGNGSPETSLVEPGTCRDLFDHYRLMLSLSVGPS